MASSQELGVNGSPLNLSNSIHHLQLPSRVRWNQNNFPNIYLDNNIHIIKHYLWEQCTPYTVFYIQYFSIKCSMSYTQEAQQQFTITSIITSSLLTPTNRNKRIVTGAPGLQGLLKNTYHLGTTCWRHSNHSFLISSWIRQFIALYFCRSNITRGTAAVKKKVIEKSSLALWPTVYTNVKYPSLHQSYSNPLYSLIIQLIYLSQFLPLTYTIGAIYLKTHTLWGCGRKWRKWRAHGGNHIHQRKR